MRGTSRGSNRGTGAGTGTVVAAAAALVAVCGCTVQPPGADGRQRAPVRVDVSSPPPVRPPSQPAPPSSSRPPTRSLPPARPQPASPARPPSDDRPAAAPVPRPSASPVRPPAPVLWSRGDTGRDVRELQARLRQLEWLFEGPTGTYGELTERAVRGFQTKRGLPPTGRTDTVTWQRLLGMTREPGYWDLYLMGGQPAAAPDARCLTGRVLCISKTSRTLRWMIDGRTVTTLPVRFGSDATPTRDGVFQVYWKSRDHWSTLYDTPMPYAMFFSGGQAVHYSADFAARGYAGASHGCVNVRDEAAIAELFRQVRDGDKVVVYR
ncbi:ErfK/YbiS/YcfS/YnhG [Streptomyces cyaneogriseus subsp. noncyanogenus]|uniref:ErfK/YbiS/YcfS/YnhG n=1 Tax=Streptomyces cyaneogriseus subsp. noncyanogenus TaxID=477245 RepID=A0A0C5GGG8_9ACTN|nr:L,D-transpeptidase family protein [Streptomyces cyaneogriseus]AJP03481.1 ErfK/YbiS/YcfS/YnhG [Streptomyces cyaneogriseus subsp. noncyanogenus]